MHFRSLARLAASFSLLLVVLPAAAEVTFVVDYDDAANEGFFDESSAPEAPGNPGATLGEQRRAAFEHALGIWAEVLDSPVDVVVRARFSETLACGAASAVLGAASPASLLRGFVGAPRGDRYYVSALADRLAGRDLDPGNPDIDASFNAALDADECLGPIGWDYSIVPEADGTSFVNTVLHELAHGLGFTNGVDPVTGSSNPGFTPFDGLLFDRTLGRYWDQMTPEERATSAQTPLSLVWMGSQVSRRVPDVLAQGAAYVEIAIFSDVPGRAPDERALLSLVAEVNRGPRVSLPAVSGPVLALTGAAACGNLGALDGAVVLLSAEAGCAIETRLAALFRAGAAGVLLQSEEATLPPSPPWLAAGEFDSPTLVIGQADFEELLALATSRLVGAVLGLDQTRFAGADDHGHVLMNATDPVFAGSSLAHWDGSTRRDTGDGGATGLLMEPIVRELVNNDVTELTVQLLEDIGWADAACGNGELEPGEFCDHGDDNSNAVPDACRVDCRSARCGDGVVDGSEVCDDGPALGDCPRDCGRAQPPLPAPHAWDGGISPIDYGPPQRDSGAAPPVEAGPSDAATPDADTPNDAGAPPPGPDGTASRPDAGSPPGDAAVGPSLRDGGTPDAGDADVGGVGDEDGCGCGLVGATGLSAGPTWPLLVVLLWLYRRRSGDVRPLSG